MIEFYRIYLFLGMVLHKMVWEVMKRKSTSTQAVVVPEKNSGVKTAVKYAKIAFLLFLLAQALFLPEIFPISTDPQALRWVGLTIYTVGLMIAILGRVQLGGNWANIEDRQVLKEQRLVEQGIYQYIRHPIYCGDLLLVLGLELALNSWLVLLIFPLSIIVYRQAKAEENILFQAFPGYLEYKQKTKMFLPYII